jgi:hypothetical protein
MSKPKPNFLAAALNKTARGVGSSSMEPSAPQVPKRQRATAARKQTPTREGRVMVSGWLPLAARGSFRLIGCWGATGQKTGVRTARPRPPGRLPVSGVAVALPG